MSVEKAPHVHPTRMRHITDEALLDALGTGGVAEARAWRWRRPAPAALGAEGADALLGVEVDFLDRGHGRSLLYGFHYLRWMSPLITAYAETGDPRYAAEWDRLFRQWYDDRDRVKGDWPGLDVIWYSLGVRARAMYVTEALAVFAGEPALSDGCWLRMMKTVVGGARWTAEEHDAFRHGNWQFVAACELLHTARVFADLPEAGRWAEVAMARILEHLDRDVRPDGGHHERSPSYHLMCLDNLERAVAVEPSLAAHPRRRAMYHWLSVLTTSGGWVPHLQDSGLIWPEGVEPVEGSHNLEASGYATFRHGDFHTVVNYGPYVGHELEPHSHHAALDFVLTGWGVPLAWEGGGPPSYDDPGYHDWYQATRAHNTLLVPGEEYTEDRRAACDRFSVSARADVFAGHHHGYGARHDREIVFVKGDAPYWVVTDRIDADGFGAGAVWQIHGLSPWTERDGGFAGTRGPGILVVPLEPPDEVLYGTGPARIPDPATRTAEYGEIHSLGLRRADGRFTVGIFPYRDEPPSVPDDWTVHADRR
ncbi:heparinase II/III family protein [Nonomuraea sp. 3-1Str]|uniref:heparinase II/III family protein n=1 Tax=Nonomuraea sp. 3-1Str TaxID=2929801 RepID=UPI00285976B9|nr:heparinase II/III family protein [Nonomuraea sp. 3-1Str]MDR8414020.1 heparinase II/III family protein [Nonomuraea sp. 3-1Str]